jgi:1,4-alpha-glucan branching enzyme
MALIYDGEDLQVKQFQSTTMTFNLGSVNASRHWYLYASHDQIVENNSYTPRNRMAVRLYPHQYHILVL